MAGYVDNVCVLLAGIDAQMGIVSRRRAKQTSGPDLASSKADRLARLAAQRERLSDRLAAHIAREAGA